MAVAAQLIHHIEKMDVILHHAKDAAECLIHTILFHRAIGVPTQLVREVACQYFKATFMKAADQYMEAKLEKALENLGKRLNESHTKSIKLIITFYNSSWTFTDVFEKWVLSIKQLPPAEGQDENYINKVSEVLRNRMTAIAIESLRCDYSKLIEDRSLVDNFKVDVEVDK